MQEIQRQPFRISGGALLPLVFIPAAAVAAGVIGMFPLQLSIMTVFLFAGPHNLMEFRYFAARMPVRWGRSRVYYSVGIGGVLALTAAYIALYFAAGNWLWSVDTAATLSGLWNTAFILWIGALVWLRGKQRRRDHGWAIPAALGVAAASWMAPHYWSLSLIYVHPLVALWFLDRQIRRTKTEWLRPYHFCLATIPVFLLVLWMTLANTPDLPEETRLIWRIAQHAGSELLPGFSSHFLVAAHVFLETIHYFAWILLIPLVDKRAVPWRFSRVPMFARGGGLRIAFSAVVLIGAVVVLALWTGFTIDYLATRDIYFAFAIGHVLAEVPFLVKAI